MPTATGLSSGNPFKVGVCGRCNSLCGTYVDGMFTRSWLLHSARCRAALHHIDVENAVAPLWYMGRTEFRTEQLEADLWLGPAGDAVYHLHEPYPREYSTVGVPHWTNRDNLDRGVVTVVARASNPQWHPVIARSIANELEDAPIYFLNANVIDTGNGERRSGTIPEKYESIARMIHDRIFVDGDNSQRLEIVHDSNCGHRFLAKLALGFGSLFLDESFRTSLDADMLRSLLRNKHTESWPDDLVGSRFFDAIDDKLDQLTNWRGCHLIMLHEQDGGVALSIKLYGRYYAAFKVATADYGFSRLGSPHVIWMVAPGLRLFAGPMSLVDYTIAYCRPSAKDRLALLRAHLDAAPTLPPFELSSHASSALWQIDVGSVSQGSRGEISFKIRLALDRA